MPTLTTAGLEQRVDLTAYAYGVAAKPSPAEEMAEFMAPTVATGGTQGQFNKFTNGEHFKVDLDAQRALMGEAKEISLNAEKGTYGIKPYALKIGIDKFERQGAQADGGKSLERAKTGTLINRSRLSHLHSVVTLYRTLTAAANMGKWRDPASDPVMDFETKYEEIFLATGQAPNAIAFDLGGWLVCKNHPKVVKRLPIGASKVTTEWFGSLIGDGNVEVKVCQNAIFSSGGIGNANAIKQGALRTSTFLFTRFDMADEYDASTAKAFSPNKRKFGDVYSFQQAGVGDWLQVDWMVDLELVASASAARFDLQ